jgi:hypothetical protein
MSFFIGANASLLLSLTEGSNQMSDENENRNMLGVTAIREEAKKHFVGEKLSVRQVRHHLERGILRGPQDWRPMGLHTQVDP